MFKKYFLSKLVTLGVVGLSIFLVAPSAVFANVSVTAATGGTSLSADKAANATSPAYTTLGNIVIASQAQNDMAKNQANRTLILTAPSNWAFNAGVGTGAVSGTGITFGSISVTVSTITVTYSRSNTNSSNATITISGIQVRSTNGSLLPNAGNILRTSANPGTATIAGITNGSTNFGSLSQVVGAKNKLGFTTQPSASVTVDTDFAIKPIVAMQDQFGNSVTVDTSAVTHSVVLSGQACGGSAGTGTLTSTPASGANLVSGVMTYTAMQYSVAEAIHVCTASAGVTSAKSNAIAVSKKTTTTALATSLTPQVYGTSVTFTATVTPSSGGPATGVVTFKDGVTTIGTGTLSSNVATYSTSTLSVTGSPHSITAVYGGDGTFSGSTSSAVAQTMTAKTLTVTGVTADNKIYNGTATTTLSTGSYALVGVVSGDTVTLNTSAYAATFVDKNIGTGKAITVTGLSLSGASASNYSLTQPTGLTANITAKTLTTSGITALNKIYDGGTTAYLSGGSLVGVVSGDVVSISASSSSFADKTVATGKTVTVNSITLGGTDSGNYTVTLPTGLTANITAKTLTTSGITALNKVYDGGTTAYLTGGSLVGVVGGDTVTISASSSSFATKTVADGKAVTVNSITLGGGDAGNYTVTLPTGLTANITAKNLTTSGITALNKIYDGGTTAYLSSGSLVGVVGGDTVTISASSSSFVDKLVATGKSVTVNSITLGGADGGNYTVTLPTGLTANITAKNLTVTGMSASNKEYDGNTTATLSGGSLVGVVGGDTVSIASSTATFADKNVGTGKAVTVNSITLGGTDAGNYTVSLPSIANANITAKALTVTGMTATSREYNRDTTVTLSGGDLVGVINPDVVSIDTRSGSFANKNVGTGKTITVSSVTLTGTDGGNYTVSNPTGITADITAKALTVTGMTATSREYNADVNVSLSGGSLVGVIGEDVVSINTRVGSFADKNVGTSKPITVSSVTLTGTDGGNYTVTPPTDVVGNITAKALTVSGMTATSREYNGDVDVTLGGGSLVGVIGADAVLINTRSGSFADKNVGTSKPVTVSSVTLTGTDAGNYMVTSPTDVVGNITAKALTITGMTATSREYDADVNVTLSGGSLVGVIGADVVSINTRTGSFTDKNVGTAKPITVSSVTLTGTDAGNYTVTPPVDVTANITAKTITVTGIIASDKEYDGNDTASLSGGSLVGIISPDSVSIATRVGTFSDKNVGTGKTVTITAVTISGTDSGNYFVTLPITTTASITAKVLTVTGVVVNNKEYDGNRTAILNTASASLVGVVSGDTVSLDASAYTALFDTKEVGTGKTVAVSGLALSGVDAGNYTLTQPTGLTANITGIVLTVTGMTATSREYNADVNVTLSGGLLVGIQGSDDVSIATRVGSFADKNIGTGKSVTVSAITLTGVDAANYTVTLPTGITADITAKTLTVTGMTASNKEYDGNETVTLSGGSLVGVIGADVVSINTRTGSFADKIIANGKPVTVTSITLTGTDSGNYTVTLPTGITANITTKTLTITGMTAENKEYDRGITATLSGGSLVGIISPDDVSIDTRVGTFADKNVGTGKPITVSSVTLTGIDAGNYTVANPTGITANITAKALTVDGMTATSREYDRDINVTLSGGSLIGVISPDVVSIDTRVGSFTDKTVGVDKPVTVSSVTLTGIDSGNYTVTNPTGIVASITAKTITVTGITVNDKPYDGNMTATLNTTGAAFVGVISGDTVTLDTSAVTASFATPDVELDKSVSVSGLALSGTDGANYSLTQPTGFTASILNPSPVTTSISPTYKETGDLGFTLTINGSGFMSNSIVKLNGDTRATTFVNSGQLTAEILTSDLVAPTSTVAITVFTPTPGGGTSNAQTFVVVRSATQFVILPPAVGSVEASSTITVQAQKANGVVDTSFQDDVTLNVNGSATGGGLVDIVNGEGTISVADTVAQTVHLTLSDTQNTHLAVTSSQDLVFAPGAVTQYTLNSPGNMNARTRLGYQVTRADQYGNSVLAGALTAYLYTTSLSTDRAFYDDSMGGNVITEVSFADTSATANFWYYDDMPGTYTISVSDNLDHYDGTAGIDDATRDVTVIPVAVKFVITVASSASVDASTTVTIEAQKTDNTIDTSFQDDVTLNLTGLATGAGLVNIVNGVGTKQIADTTIENVTLSLSDTQGAGLDVSSTADVSFTGGVTTQVTLSDQITLSAGSRAEYTVTRKDQYGNITNLGDITLYLYSSSVGANKKFYNAATNGSVITSVNISSGQESAQFWYYDETPGTWSITASDSFGGANGPVGMSDAVDVLDVTAGPVASFTLNTPGDMTAKTRLGYTVTRKDQFGNLVTGGDTIAYLYTSAGPLGTERSFHDAAINGSAVSSVTISNGNSQSSFWYYEETAGSFTVTASDSSGSADGAVGILDGTRDVTVHPAPIVATKFVILTPPINGTVDAPVTITIQAQDNAGNLDTSATSSVRLVTSGSASGAGLVTMLAGVGTIQISDHNAEIVHLSLADTEHTGLDVSSTQDVLFSTGAATQVSIDNPGDMAAGSRLGFTITRKDQYGNLVTSGVTTVDLSSSSLGVNKKFYDAVSGGTVITSVNILDGQSTAQFWYYDELAGSATVTLSGTGITGSFRTFTVTPSVIAKFLMNDPGNMTARTRLGYTLMRKDTFDNPVTSGIVSAYLYSSAAGTSTKFYDTVTGGSPTTVVSFADGSATANFWYYEEAPGTWVITASDGTPTPNGPTGIADAADSVTVTISLITATRFVIQPVNNVMVNTPVTVTIRAEDESGNVDTTYNHNVMLVTSGSASGGGLVTVVNGVGTKTINDSVAETVALSLLDSQATGLNVSSLRTITFSAVYIPRTPSPSGGVPTEAPPIISGLHVGGRAFPGALLNIIPIGGSGDLQSQKGKANTKSDFSINWSGTTGGASAFAIMGTDKNGNNTQVKIFDANMASAKLKLDVNGILLSPTVSLVRTAVTKGDVLGMSGAGVPGYKVEIQIDNQPSTITATVDSKGAYKAIISTSELELGSHTIRTRQTSPAGLASDYSPQKVFSIVNIFTPNLDLNSDGVMNVQDYSIFVSRWNSKNAGTRSKNDLNGDGKIDVQDFSIFIRTLKIK